MVSAVPWPTDLLLDLRDAIADPTDGDYAGTDDHAAAGRVALYRAATGPLLNDPELADRLGPTLDPDSHAEWVGRASSQETFWFELSTTLLPQGLIESFHVHGKTARVDNHEEDSHAHMSPLRGLVLAPPVEFGRIPWAALPIGNRTLVECAALVLAPPLGTLLRAPATVRLNPRPESAAAPTTDNTLWVINTRGDLLHCRAIPTVPAQVLSASTSPPATREVLLEALAETRFDALVIRSHVRAGTPGDPLSTALLLSDDTELTARDLLEAGVAVPQRCIILGCDAAGAATGSEWAGLPLGLSSAGATVLVMTLWPVVDDARQQALDLDLLSTSINDPVRGLSTWQQIQARQWRERAHSSAQPYRWANLGLVATSRAIVNV